LRQGFGLLRLVRDAGATVDLDRIDVASASDSSSSACGGAFVAGACWYLGAFDQSCDTVCTAHGGYSPDTELLTGATAQGGSADMCRNVFRSLGESGALTTTARGDGLGLGCHKWNNAGLYWLTSPNETSSVATTGTSAQRACACLR
jgi:hypothetical protein